MFSSLQNSSGNTIVMVLGISAVIGFGFTHVATRQSKTSTEVVAERTQRYYVDMYNSFVESMLKNPIACFESLGGAPPTGAVAQLRSAPTVPFLQPGQVLGGDKANTSRVTVVDIRWGPNSDANGGDLELVYSGSINQVTRPYLRTIRVNYSLSAGNITACAVGDAGSLAEACNSFNGTLVNSVCTSPTVTGTATFTNNLQATGSAIAGASTFNSGTVSGNLGGQSLQVDGAATLGSLSGASLTSSGTLSANSINVSSAPICAMGGCQTWMTRTCGADQFMYAVDASENILCANWY